MRILLVTDGNTNFVGVLHAYLDAARDIEVRLIGPKDLGHASAGALNRRATIISELADDGLAREAAEQDFAPHLEWADVAFVDWCTNMAHYFTLADPGTTRTILRLHSYEAWTMWPHLVDFSRIDRLVFVSDHIREITTTAAGRLSLPSAATTHVVPNAMDLKSFAVGKSPDARFTVAVLGYSAVAKDLSWALEVISRLREHDERYCLLLIGGDMSDSGTPAHSQYRRSAYEKLAELERSGGAFRSGHTEDVPAALTPAGVILSSSVREGSPLAVVEGAASGAVPVVRDWPFFARCENGPRRLYPREWVVATEAEAVQRILSVTQDESVWKAVSENISKATIDTWDIEVTQHQFQDLFFS